MAADDKQGFAVRGKFYPYIPLQKWKRGDAILAQILTQLGDDLFDGNHSLSLQDAFLAVAVAHANPQLSHKQIIQFVHDLGVDEVEEVGFEIVEDDEDDARPPDESSAPSNSSSESGTASSDATSSAT
jgi:hypothetical protein